MAAGLGFKDFTTGEVLTAADVDGYLMQGIWVFASAAARDAAVTSPQEGNFAFLKDTNTTTYYTGSAWTNLDTTGMVNPMTTTGDTIYSSSGSTPARLGIGTAGQVLQVNSGATAPEWATPAGGGGMTLLSTTTLSGSATTISGISGSYKQLLFILSNITPSTTATLRLTLNGLTTSIYGLVGLDKDGTSAGTVVNNNTANHQITTGTTLRNSDTESDGYIYFTDYTDTTKRKNGYFGFSYIGDGNVLCSRFGNLNWNDPGAITSATFTLSTGTYSDGTIKTYGVS